MDVETGDARRPRGVRGIACVIARALTAANTPSVEDQRGVMFAKYRSA